MKKSIVIPICIIIGILLFLTCYDYQTIIHPKDYYNVYLDGNIIGVINSDADLEKYIDEKAKHVINLLKETKEYCPVDESKILPTSVVEYYTKDKIECASVTNEKGTEVEKIHAPENLKTEKILSYKGQVNTIEEIYKKIVELKDFNIKGYQFTIRDEDNSFTINTLDKDIFEKATTELIKTYVDEEEYNAYLNGTQEKIKTTGKIIDNVYISEDISVKELLIPISEKIYTDYHELSQFLLYGDSPVTKTYVVKKDEMVEDIALNNEINVQEFLISNDKYKNSNSLITPGTEVKIKETSPKLKVVVETSLVEDMVNQYKTIYQYDENQYLGYEKTIQTGQDGLIRVSQSVQTVNGLTTYVEPKGKEILKSSVDAIILKGEKFVQNVGNLKNWDWPSESGWTISDGYEWRTNPFSGNRQFHQALDIAGTGYGSKVYAANNGTITTREYHYSFGYYIIINHNNGYQTLYAHLSKFADVRVGQTVSRGQLIGYVGSTGDSTGPHIHFEVWKGCQFCRINPWSLYR